MKCPICGKSFYVKEARKEFENYFNNELKYDDSFEVRMCSDCAIKKMEEIKARVSQESEDDAKEFFESFADSTEEDSERMVSILDSIYETVVDGIPHVSQSVEDLASDYLLKNDDINKAAKSLTRNQIAKCGTSGFLTGLGGIITLPVAIPANISSVWYVQMRMIATLAYIGGYDIHSDQVQTLTYVCLTGSGAADILKTAGINFAEQFSKAAIKKIPGEVCYAINRKVGFRFITKFGEKGVINLGKLVPVVGGVIGGITDVASTKIIAKNAEKIFINEDE